MAKANKPSVLVSSTIYDFADLRSALKYWLSELGYDVMVSEFNDFPKALDDNSYESCLKAIACADFFLLLIGARVGGWFDKANRISITRMEFRKALESFKKTGKPRLAIFVRQNIWDIKEDRNALETQLRLDNETSRELSADVKARLVQHPSRFVNDAETIFNFLREVGQVEEMKAASEGKGEFPKANWIHQFSNFSDIANALRVTFGINIHVDRLLLIENLKRELGRNLSHLLFKSEKLGVRTIASWGKHAADSIVGGVDDRSTMPALFITWLVIFRVYAMNVSLRLSTLFIEQAVGSGVFMEFSAQTGCFETTRGHELLAELLTLIGKVQHFQSANVNDLQPFAEKFRSINKSEGDVTVSNLELGVACWEVRQMERITTLHGSLLKWINGDNRGLDNLLQWPASPYPKEAEKITRNQVTAEEAIAWLNASK